MEIASRQLEILEWSWGEKSGLGFTLESHGIKMIR